LLKVTVDYTPCFEVVAPPDSPGVPIQIKSLGSSATGFHALKGKDKFGPPRRASRPGQNRVGAGVVALSFGQFQLAAHPIDQFVALAEFGRLANRIA
jgi:hypothetical protein